MKVESSLVSLDEKVDSTTSTGQHAYFVKNTFFETADQELLELRSRAQMFASVPPLKMAVSSDSDDEPPGPQYYTESALESALISEVPSLMSDNPQTPQADAELSQAPQQYTVKNTFVEVAGDDEDDEVAELRDIATNFRSERVAPKTSFSPQAKAEEAKPRPVPNKFSIPAFQRHRLRVVFEGSSKAPCGGGKS
jgi:hypothetical protein